MVAKKPAINLQKKAVGVSSKPLRVSPKSVSQKVPNSKILINKKVQKTTLKKKVRTKGIRKPFWLKEAVLASVNIIFVVGLIFILTKLPQKATTVSALKAAKLETVGNGESEINIFEIQRNAENIDKLTSLFPGEEGLLIFVDEIEKLKLDGTVQGFTFANKDPVTDKTNSFGLPVIIELRGNWQQINRDLEEIQKFSFLFRPANFNATVVRDEGVVDLRYGGFLYVDEKLKEN